MFLELVMRLGKFVQGILNKFRKKKPESFIGKQAVIQDGELYINGEPFGKIMSIENLSLDEFEKTGFPAKLKRDMKWECSFDMEMSEEEKELLEKLANISYPVLPKRIDVPTLLISVYANWEYDSIGVDISQLEETGIAHYFCTSTKSMEEWEADFCERTGQDPIGVGESETVAIKNAKLYQWESGLWTWEP